MALLDTNDPRPIHFVGVAGAGMSALAELFLRRGVPITGCDANPSGAEDLVRLGVTVPSLDAALPRLRALGSRIDREPTADSRTCVVRDPDDNPVELSQVND